MEQKKIIRGIAIFDLALTLPLSIPNFALLIFRFIFLIDDFFELESMNQVLDSFHILFINIVGIICVLWAIIRIVQPTQFYSIADSVCRVYISIIIGYYIFYRNVSPLMSIFLFTEIIGAVIQIVGYIKNKKYKF